MISGTHGRLTRLNCPVKAGIVTSCQPSACGATIRQCVSQRFSSLPCSTDTTLATQPGVRHKSSSASSTRQLSLTSTIRHGLIFRKRWHAPLIRRHQHLRHASTQVATSKCAEYNLEETGSLYTKLTSLAISGQAYEQCWDLARYLVRERHQAPNLRLYNALILSNVAHDSGSAWRVHDLLAELYNDGLQPDNATCHAVLQVLAVHPDHLLRADILEYMKSRWYAISSLGAHHIAAGLLREGLFEQALAQIESMQAQEMVVESWLWDLATHQFCSCGEVDGAYQIISRRHDAGETYISQLSWYTLLDHASARRHLRATKLAWMYRVKTGYLNPPAGICLNVLTTASIEGDKELASDVFSHMSKHRMSRDSVHYDLLISSHLNSPNPDLSQGFLLLSQMAKEGKTPSSVDTRHMYSALRTQLNLTDESLACLRDIQKQGLQVPIAALNLIIECYVDQNRLDQAVKVYKMIHTFSQIGETRRLPAVDINTVNLLLKGCRKAEPPNEQLSSFLISEMLALKIQPTRLTFDRLILVFVQAASRASEKSETKRGLDLLDWAYRYYREMQPLNWMPRRGTIAHLAVGLAERGDERCWEVLQTAHDNAETIENWHLFEDRIRRKVESVWSEQADSNSMADKTRIDAID